MLLVKLHLVLSQHLVFYLESIVSITDPAIGSWTLLDVCGDIVLAACASPNQLPYLVNSFSKVQTNYSSLVK